VVVRASCVGVRGATSARPASWSTPPCRTPTHAHHSCARSREPGCRAAP
jgi:hypothetical protein